MDLAVEHNVYCEAVDDLLVICGFRQDSGVWGTWYNACVEQEEGQDAEGSDSSLLSSITYEGISSTGMCLPIGSHLD